MATHYVLIDYENVQPKDLSLLQGRPCKTLVFVGKSQNLTVDRANALQPLGQMGECIQVNGNGRNALDFHIAFRLGELAARAPGAVFCIISRDKASRCSRYFL